MFDGEPDIVGAGVDDAHRPVAVAINPPVNDRVGEGAAGLGVRHFRIDDDVALGAVDRAGDDDPLADIKADSLDFYASIRSFYLQTRKREVENGRTNYEDLPDIGEFEEFDELE